MLTSKDTARISGLALLSGKRESTTVFIVFTTFKRFVLVNKITYTSF